MLHVNKNLLTEYNALTEFYFHTSISRSLENSDMNKKPLSLSLYSSFCSATKSLQSFSRVSFPASKLTPMKLILKKGLLQYSSSIRKKTAPQYNSNSLNCKKPRAPQNSSAQLTASQL